MVGRFVATSGEKRWPPVGKFVAASGEKPMAIDKGMWREASLDEPAITRTAGLWAVWTA